MGTGKVRSMSFAEVHQKQASSGVVAEGCRLKQARLTPG